MLNVNNLKFCYPSNFTLDVNCSLPQGARVAVIGPSGSGKSTFFALLSGFLKANSGELYFHEKNITHTEPGQRPISYIFQEHNLFEHLTIQQNVGLGLHTKFKFSQKEKDKIFEALTKFNIELYQNEYPTRLSGGQRQRVALARCALENKPILLLDEAIQSVGPEQRKSIMSHIISMQQSYPKTLLFITHHKDVMSYLATHILFLDQGRISFFGTLENFFLAKNLEKFSDYIT